MKTKLLFIFLMIATLSCKKEPKNQNNSVENQIEIETETNSDSETVVEVEKDVSKPVVKEVSNRENIQTSNPKKEIGVPKTIEGKIAYGYGIDNWSNVNQVDFSFVVNPGEKEMLRRWSWKPKIQEVSLIKDNDTITYNRKDISKDLTIIDSEFINDSFWLLFPFHLVWDDVEIITYENQVSPILAKKTTKLRVNYPEVGGYTPGDSYEVYVDENYNIVEWTHHRGGHQEAALRNTFENQQSFNGIKIDMNHNDPDIGFQLNFRDVVIK